MELIVRCDGSIHAIYSEDIRLADLGRLNIRRASHVEPDEIGNWQIDLSPVHGPRLGPFPLRSDALQAETHWLRSHWLIAE